MGIEKIKGKITADAEREAKKLLDHAHKESDKISKANKKMVEDYRKRRETEVSAEVRLYRDRVLAQERIQAKRTYLSRREEIITKFIDDALNKIDTKSNEYKSFMKGLVDENLKLLSGDITVSCNKNDMTLVKSLVKKAKVKEAPIKGGIIFADATKTIDESMDSVFERLKNQLRQKISMSLGG